MLGKTNLLGAVTAIAFFVSAILVFAFRLLGKLQYGHWIGYFEFLLAIPLIYLLIQAPQLGRPALYYIQIGCILAWLAAGTGGTGLLCQRKPLRVLWQDRLRFFESTATARCPRSSCDPFHGRAERRNPVSRAGVLCADPRLGKYNPGNLWECPPCRCPLCTFTSHPGFHIWNVTFFRFDSDSASVCDLDLVGSVGGYGGQCMAGSEPPFRGQCDSGCAGPDNTNG